MRRDNAPAGSQAAEPGTSLVAFRIGTADYNLSIRILCASFGPYPGGQPKLRPPSKCTCMWNTD
jgi:hypothetical protein